MSKKLAIFGALIGLLFAIPGYCWYGAVEQGDKFSINNFSYQIKKIKYDKAEKEEIYLNTNDHQIEPTELKQLASDIKKQIKARSGKEVAVECEVEGKNLVECDCTPLPKAL